MRRVLQILAVAVLAGPIVAPPAVAQGGCLTDALGTTRCIGGSSFRTDALGIRRDLKGNNLAIRPDPRQPGSLPRFGDMAPPIPDIDPMGKQPDPAGCTRQVGALKCP